MKECLWSQFSITLERCNPWPRRQSRYFQPIPSATPAILIMMSFDAEAGLPARLTPTALATCD